MLKKKIIRTTPVILFLEDDYDQSKLLMSFARKAIDGLSESDSISESLQRKIRRVEIVSVGDIKSLDKATAGYDRILLAVLDCNTSDAKGLPAHNQFVKDKHVITGQHKAVDLVIKNSPNTPITIISALGRFQSIVRKYYAKNNGLNIDFIAKRDSLKIRQHIHQELAAYFEAMDVVDLPESS